MIPATQKTIAEYSVEHIVFDASPEAIVVLDTIGRIVRVNRRLGDWLGYSQDELVGKHLLQLPFLSQETKAFVVKKFITRMTGKPVETYTIECIAKNGQIKIGRVRGNVLQDDAGKRIGDIVMVEEATKEEEYRQLAMIRADIIEAVGYVADQFLQKRHWRTQLPQAFRHLGKASRAEHVYLLHLRPDEKELAEEYLEYWSYQQLSSQQFLQLFSREIFEQIIHSKKKTLKRDLFISLSREKDGHRYPRFFSNGQRATSVIFPVFLGERLWGVLGFDNIASQAKWTNHEWEALLLARNIIQAALQQEKNVIAIEKRDAILELTNNFTHSLQHSKQVHNTFQRYFSVLGKTLGADVVSYIPLTLGNDGRNVRRVIWQRELTNGSTLSPKQMNVFKQYEQKLFSVPAQDIFHFAYYEQPRHHFPELEQLFSQFLLIPVVDSSQTWGMIVIGAVQYQMTWSEAELDAMRVFARMIGSSLARRKSLYELEQREHILTAVSEAAKHFLKYESWQQDMPKILKKIGQSISANQVILVINDLNQQVYEWCDDPLAVCSPTDVFQEVLHGKGVFRAWKKQLAEGNVVALSHENVDAEARSYFRQNLAENVVMFPFFVKGKWWGILTILHRDQEHLWNVAETQSFQIATDIISAAIQNNLTELELRKTVEYWKQEEQKVEEAGRERQKFELAVSGSTDAVIITDTTPQIIYVNPAWEKLTGYAFQEVQGKSPTMLKSGRTPRRVYRELWARLHQGKSYVTDEMINKRKDGEEYPARISFYPVQVHGKNIYYMGIQQDISEWKKVEQLKTDFISIASHQMNTPLSALRWLLELYQKKYEATFDNRQREMIQEMYESTLRMIDLITSLLNIARVESGRMMIEVKKVNFNNLIQQVISEIKPLAEKKKIRIQFSSLRSKSMLQTDPRLLTHIINNLISNAIKYSPPKSRITVSLKRKQNMFECHVKDQGCGIPKEEQKNIFTKFYRASNVVHKEVDGSGLGLYLVKLLVESAGGEIQFTSVPENGTDFWFTVPEEGMKSKAGEVSLTHTLEMDTILAHKKEPT